MQEPKAGSGSIPESEVQEPKAGSGGIPESEVMKPKAGSGGIPSVKAPGVGDVDLVKATGGDGTGSVPEIGMFKGQAPGSDGIDTARY